MANCANYRAVNWAAVLLVGPGLSVIQEKKMSSATPMKTTESHISNSEHPEPGFRFTSGFKTILFGPNGLLNPDRVRTGDSYSAAC
jgi:hypothetical protein